MSEALTQLERRGALVALDVELARSLGRMAGESDPDVLLALALASRTLREGHVCAELATFAGQPLADEQGAPAGPPCPERAAWLDKLGRSALVASGLGAGQPLVLDAAGRLYFARYYDHELSVAAHIARLSARQPEQSPLDPALLERLFPARAAGERPDLQRQAVLAARGRNLSLIVGGPGTGKTSTVVRLLALLVEDSRQQQLGPPKILLLAPTGKAAQRLSEAVGRAREALPVAEETRLAIPSAALTIHRALKSDAAGLSFQHHAQNPLDCDLLLLDEASMVDLALLRRLLDALPERARVIMLGDPDQLAAVEAGGVLVDLCQAADTLPALARCLSRLSESYRYAPDSGIAQLAQAVHAQDAEQALRVLAGDLPDAALYPAPSPQAARGALWEHARERYAGLRASELAQRLHALDQYRVLCAHRAGPAGVEQLNRRLARAVHGAQRGEYYAGRPLLIGQNDYATRLFNGDVGVLHAARRGAALAAYFPGAGGAARELSLARLPQHESVYAMTVHKSQGSEFREVAIVLPEHASPLLSRELLFTAITRAREGVRLYASPQAIRAALARRIQRSSGLVARLSSAWL